MSIWFWMVYEGVHLQGVRRSESDSQVDCFDNRTVVLHALINSWCNLT
jgi:hypothetical protein